MPSFAPITIANSAATNVTFNPSEKTSGGQVYVYVDSNADVRLRRKITASRQPSTGKTMERIKIRVMIPFVSVDMNSVSTVEQTFCNLEVVVPPGTSLTTRRDLVAFIKNLMGSTWSDEVIGQGFGVY